MSVRSRFLLNSDYGTIKEVGSFDETFVIPQFTVSQGPDESQAVAEKIKEFSAKNINGLENCTIDFSGTGVRAITTPAPVLVYAQSVDQGMYEIIIGIRKTSNGKAQIYAYFYIANVPNPVTFGPLTIRARSHVFASPFES